MTDNNRASFSTEVVGMLDENCYIVNIPESRTIYIIDPGSEDDRIIKTAKTYDFDKVVILLTHAHVDHIGAVRAVADALGVTNILLHPNDLPLYKSPDNHLMPFVPPAKKLPEPTFETNHCDFSIIETPGHTRGGVCYHFKQIPALFSGDTLFCQSIGRTDLPGGDLFQLKESIVKQLFTLPDELKVYPGHGSSTTIGEEKQYNPHTT